MESSDQKPSDSQKTPEKQIAEIASWKPAMKWDTKFVICYILSVSLDPLLLYSLILNDDRKCVVVDTKLKIIAIVLRSLADLSYIGPIICEIPDITKRLRLRLSFMRLRLAFRRLNGEEVDNCYAWKVETFEIVKILTIAFWRRLSIPMAILAALPVPQIAILVFFPKLRASRALNRMRIMNSLILLQYVPRIYLIYRDCINLNKKKLDNYISDIKRKAWVPWLLNFILYILASHVFGAFWYFFSIQRQIECWGYGCQSGNGCEFRIFDCDDGTLRNVTLLNDLCPVNPSNAKVFDFGIYLDALQSGMLGSTDFSRKGLAVFLLGHTKSKATNKEYWILLKMWKMRSEIELMSNAYGLSNADWAIWYIVRRQFRRDEDLAVENIFSILPITVQDIIKRHKEVPRLQRMDQKVLDAILKDIEQVIYDGGNYIIREGEPLDMMIFISRGSVLTYNTTSTGHGGGGC